MLKLEIVKTVLRHFLVNLLAIYLASLVVGSGLSWGGDTKVLLMAAAALGLVNIFVRPVVDLLAFPFKLLASGLVAVAINAGMLYLTTRLVPEFVISGFYFPGANLFVIIIPSANVTVLWAFIIVAGLMSLVTTFINWLVVK